jgi:hypothetical protein
MVPFDRVHINLEDMGILLEESADLNVQPNLTPPPQEELERCVAVPLLRYDLVQPASGS